MVHYDAGCGLRAAGAASRESLTARAVWYPLYLLVPTGTHTDATPHSCQRARRRVPSALARKVKLEPCSSADVRAREQAGPGAAGGTATAWRQLAWPGGMAWPGQSAAGRAPGRPGGTGTSHIPRNSRRAHADTASQRGDIDNGRVRSPRGAGRGQHGQCSDGKRYTVLTTITEKVKSQDNAV